MAKGSRANLSERSLDTTKASQIPKRLHSSHSLAHPHPCKQASLSLARADPTLKLLRFGRPPTHTRETVAASLHSTFRLTVRRAVLHTGVKPEAKRTLVLRRRKASRGEAKQIGADLAEAIHTETAAAMGAMEVEVEGEARE